MHFTLLKKKWLALFTVSLKFGYWGKKINKKRSAIHCLIYDILIKTTEIYMNIFYTFPKIDLHCLKFGYKKQKTEKGQQYTV